jgi:nucleoside-diphosphate-sugar epimerase
MIGNKRVLLTGASGFIGSHIATQLVESGFQVIATKRDHSDLKRCKNIHDSILWINTNDANWEQEVIQQNPEILIHTAWEGVKAEDRNNWDIQVKNFEFSSFFFKIAIESGVNKIITLGSQAEYGTISGGINEQFIPRPVDAYGAYKLHTCNYLRIMSQQHKINWYWLRVFSVFGPNDNELWLLPKVIKSLLKNEPINLTKCEQRYDYLYSKDFTFNLMKVVNSNSIESSGIYNFSSGTAIKLKDLLISLSKIIGVSEELLKFGAIPYRSIQSMHIEGDCTKFNSVFGNIEITNIEQALTQTVNYYKQEK